MRQFNIEVISKQPEIVDGFLSYWGRITIGEFFERFVMTIENWKLQDYLEQWKEGLDRLKKQNFSCLVVNVQNLDTYPSIETWNLYKDKDIIYLQNSLLIDETVEHKPLKLTDFDRYNCYQFIDYPRETITEDGQNISEWAIEAEDFFSSLDKICNR